MARRERLSDSKVPRLRFAHAQDSAQGRRRFPPNIHRALHGQQSGPVCLFQQSCGRMILFREVGTAVQAGGQRFRHSGGEHCPLGDHVQFLGPAVP